MKKTLVVILCLFLLLSIVACGRNSEDGSSGSSDEHPEVIRIGVYFPFTGGSATMGHASWNGAKMAFDNHNAAGGIKSMGGAQIEFVLADTTSVVDVGVTEVERLIVRENVDILFGAYNSAVGAATAPIADRYGIPLLLVSSNVDTIMENDYTYVFRANYPNSTSAETQIEYLQAISQVRGTPLNSVFIVFENSDFGAGMASNMDTFARAAGLNVLGYEGFTTNAPDLSSIVLKVKEANPDIVLAVMYINDSVLFTTQMYELDCTVPLFGVGGGFTIHDFIEKTGRLSQGVMATAGFSYDLIAQKPPISRQLYDQFARDYAPEPGVQVDDHAAAGYTNAAVLIRVLEDAGSLDPDAIVEAFRNLNITDPNDPVLAFQAWEGVVFGQLRNMRNQNTLAKNVVVQVIDGEYRMVGPVSVFEGGNTPAIWPLPPWAERIN